MFTSSQKSPCPPLKSKMELGVVKMFLYTDGDEERKVGVKIGSWIVSWILIRLHRDYIHLLW